MLSIPIETILMINKTTYLLLALLCTIFFTSAQESNKITIKNQNDLLEHIVILNNKKSIVPLMHLEDRKIVSVHTPSTLSGIFNKTLNQYANVDDFSFSGALTFNHSQLYNTFIFQVTDKVLQNPQTINYLSKMARDHEIIIVGFGSLYGLSTLNDLDAPIIWSEDTTSNAAIISAEILFGGLGSTTRLRANVSSHYQAGDGYSTKQIRLRYSNPEAVGLDGNQLTRNIDAIAEEAINERATPGAVVMVVKNKQVIFQKAYGYHTYEKKVPEKVDDIFDLASVSKIAATTLAVMHLTETGKINLNETIGHYLKTARQSNKADIPLRDVMLHQAGFIPYIPFYRSLKEKDHSTQFSADFPTKIADGYYLRKDYFEEVMWPKMLASKVKPPGHYVYSDISMYVMQRVIEKQTHTTLDQYVKEHFYTKLGMQSTGYNPWQYFARSRIVPTERDTYFRDTLLVGYVHDQGAAMAGGVAGHAGLFSTANDLAIYGQMLLNRGTYGGEKYFKPETVDLFTSQQGDNSRRGLGFDRWDPDLSKEYPSRLASDATFGHTGYTGTCIWIDPKYQLVYIFLSNRVHPTVSPKLSNLDIRSRIQDAIYEAILKN